MPTIETDTMVANAPAKISPVEATNNYYFRCGDKAHTFEYGGVKNVAEWRSRKEADVLIERVTSGMKPVASFVLANYRLEERLSILRKCRHLHRRIVRNPWKVYELIITATPDATLFDLLNARELECDDSLREKLAPNLIDKRTVREYVARSFDLNGPCPVTPLECGLLYGYPLV